MEVRFQNKKIFLILKKKGIEFFQCGTVWTNCWMLRDLRMPFGGIKDSGIGREGYPYSEEVFTEIKTVCINIA